MAMSSSPTPTKISLPLLFLVFFTSSSLFSHARTSPFTNNNSNELLRLSPAEKLIRSLNLFPEKPVNIRESGGEDGVFVPGKIVENKFSLFADSVEQDLGHHAGYYSLRTKASRMFYLFFESRNNNKDDPVVIWLTGGPGCGSELALFYENGPFHITNNLSLVSNDYGWDKVSNILFVDQPVGTGFSDAFNYSDIPHDEEGVSNDLYDFLQAFFKEHPELVTNDFYITGESYAGHYIPALASRIQQGNKEKQGILINLKGLAIGNGLTDPGIQYQAYTDFALFSHLITKNDYNNINKLISPCEEAVQTCATEGEDSCVNAKATCDAIFSSIFSIRDNGDINYYDIRKKCDGGPLCYDFSNMENFLKEERVREALGVGNLTFVSCSRTVYDAMRGDWMKNLESGIPALLDDGIRLLVYAGEYDFICNWIGNERWVHAMQWSGQKKFETAPTVQFIVNGEGAAGEIKSFGPLSFLKVHNAGHMVPMDQPKVALDMITRWMQGKLSYN